MSNALLNGLVIASYGKRYGVELEDGTELSCVTRGKKTDLACGDKVKVKLTGPNEAVVEQLEPRSSLLYRSNSFRSKMLAANVSQAVIVLATQPSFYEELLNRCLVACEAAGIKAVIVLNKCDLDNADDVLLRLQDYAGLGYTIQPLSARDNIAPLKQWLQGETSVLVGQSGMGKSTIVNALLPDKMVRTQEVSTVLDSGKHTTTAAHLYHLDAQSKLIDSPGLQEFGLHHLDAEQLELAFVEFRPYLGQCRFNNCRHLKEPDCAIQAAVDAGAISPRRLGFYQQLRQEMT
ncbi:ribosome small subunit-dependent GTPase A [Methylobacillus methanolivorans]|uniref:Small ribosomal subunit biogenesis GTPase RsgA n=1 Tax=Methylobacillus methanolivorans TaxID=1848927 RepID=A0ABW8GJT0_9PROT